MPVPPHAIFLLVPSDLEDILLEPLREHFAGDEHVEVVVERRTSARRDGIDDRILRLSAEQQAERRAQTVPRDLPALPEDLAEYASELRVVQRLTPVRPGLEDLSLDEVARAAQDGDPEAPTELYWRTYERVSRRLQAHVRDPRAAEDAVKGTYGRIFDELPAFDPEASPLHVWLDRVVDAHAKQLLSES